jgi:hypothetical protein
MLVTSLVAAAAVAKLAGIGLTLSASVSPACDPTRCGCCGHDRVSGALSPRTMYRW